MIHEAAAAGYFYKYVTSDFRGERLAISGDGLLSAGAYQSALPSAYVLTSRSGTSATNVLEVGVAGALTLPAERAGAANPWWRGSVDLYEGALAIAWGATGLPCSFAASVTGDGTLTATLDGEALGSAVAADGKKTFAFRNYDGVRALRLEFAGKGVVRLSNFSCSTGVILIVQ